MTEDYCTFEEVEKGKRGGKRDVELHLSFTLSGDFIRPVDERASSAQRKSRADTKRCFWELTPERERALYSPHVKRGGSAWTKQNKENHFQNNQMRLVLFHLDVPLCAQSCKELRQTDLHYSSAEGEQKTTRRGERTPPLLFLFAFHW